DRSRVAPDDERPQVLDDAGEPTRRAVRVRDLGPADEPVVGRGLQEDPGTPAGVAEEGLERGDLHVAGEYGGRPTSGSVAAPLATSRSARSQSPSSSTLNPSRPCVRKGASTLPSRVPVSVTTRVQAIS